MTTPQNPQIAAALEKARAKREIADLLAPLPLEAQRDILADLMVIADGQAAVETIARRVHALVEKRESLRAAAPTKVVRKGTGGVRGPGRPRGSVAGGSMADKLYETLKTHPRMSIGELAAKHYPGEDVEKGKHKVRAVLWSLKNQKRATNVEPGKWEVTA